MQNLKSKKKIIMKSKKALSEIISATLLVVLVVSIVGVFGVFMKNYVSQLSLSPQISCSDMSNNPPLSIEKACLNNATGDIELSLHRYADSIDINKLEFNIDFGISSQSYECSSSCGSCKILETGERKI